MIKLIASDMDGTLLSSHLSISDFNKEVIEKARSMGIEFVVATGRSYTEARPVLKESGIDCEMITGNGAQVFDEHEQISYTVSLEKQTVVDIIKILSEHNLYFELMTTEGVYSNSREQRIENIATMLAENIPGVTYKIAIAMAASHLDSLPVEYVDDYMTLVNNEQLEILKIITFSQHGPKKLDPISDLITNLGSVCVTSSFPNNLEINHENATKGHAVAKLAKEKGISMDEVLTIGDNFNDVSMLRIAGVSFAMGNAEPGVKKVAKYETDSNADDGVGKAILRAIDENL